MFFIFFILHVTDTNMTMLLRRDLLIISFQTQNIYNIDILYTYFQNELGQHQQTLQFINRPPLFVLL